MVLMGGVFAAQSLHSLAAALQPQACAFAMSTTFPQAHGDFYVDTTFKCSGRGGLLPDSVQPIAVLIPLSDPPLWLAFYLPLLR